jgi:N-acetylmuramoyl-L-alanine amidase
VVAYWAMGLFYASSPWALTPEDQYYKAEACYRKLRTNAAKYKYRHHWLSCIDKFEKAYQLNPAGPWAAASLYMSGKLYLELYRYSQKASDKQEAVDLFKRISKRFPSSAYRKKAAKVLDSISDEKRKTAVSKKKSSTKKRTTKKPPASVSSAVKKSYNEAESCYRALLKSPKKQKYRSYWFSCIGKFRKGYRIDSSDPWAAACLYMSGTLTYELYQHSYKKSDKEDALTLLAQVVENHPTSDYAAKALADIRRISPAFGDAIIENRKKEDEIKKIITAKKAEEAKTSSTPGPAVEQPVAAADGVSTVGGLRFWSNPNYTRVVIDADRETTYEHMILKRDPSIEKPKRLVVDVNNSRLKKDIEKFIPIRDNLLSDVRAGQNSQDVVRVVIDIKSSKTYKIFSLKNPFRIVIDVWGSSTVAAQQGQAPAAKKGDKLQPGALAKQLALGVRRIVIDPGHGGKDYGAPGYYKGVHEKYIILKIAKRLAKKIKENLKCDVVMTRSTDRFLTLEERTAIANTKNADLFISLHANSHRDKRAYGIETYFLNLATDNEAIMVAATENATSTKNISDLQMILSDLMQNAKINESSRLAAHVQNSLYSHMRKKYDRIKDKGVKQAPFYVLLGAQMPAILIETSFISNKRECKRLTNATYQDRLCDGIVDGIRRYIKEINPTAFFKNASSG